MLCQSGWNGMTRKLAKDNEDWKLYGIVFPSYALSSSSCYFVALIVFLRLYAIKQPMNYKTAHKTIGRISSILIWTFSSFASLLVFILSLPSFHTPNIHILFVTVFHLFHSLPILLTVILYAMLLYTIKQETDIRHTPYTTKRSFAKMTQGVVICLIICNVPYILWFVWIQYLGALHEHGMMMMQKVYSTNFGVNIVI